MGVKARKEGFAFGPPPSVRRLDMEKFKGVDFANNPVQVDLSRSPDCVNMISDLSGFPVKRYGYHKVKSLGGTIYGIFKLITDHGKYILVHAGTNLHQFDDKWNGGTILTTEMNKAYSQGLQFRGKLYILDGKKFRVFGDFGSGIALQEVSEVAKASKTSISRNPDGTGGTNFDDVNMLSAQRINSFLGKENEKKYVLNAKNLDSTLVKAKVLQTDGNWKEIKEKAGITVDRAKGEVTFSVAPGKSPVEGADNVEIYFYKKNQEYVDKINACTIMTIFTFGTGDWLFLSGNPKFPNLDWHSDVNDATFISDLSYSNIGQSNSSIVTYLKLGTSMAIIKTDNDQDYTAYIRNAELSEGKTVFPIAQGIVGVGAISRRATASLRDDQLFLAKDGVTAIMTQNVTSEKFAQNRSYYINPKLLKEEGLENATAVEHDGYYYLAVNGHVYVADGRQGFKSYNQQAQNSESYQYEWYYWENVPVSCWFEDETDLYFGSDAGVIYRFHNDKSKITEPNRFKDDQEDTKAHWSTPFLDFSDITRYKTLKGLWVMLNPYLRSSCDIYYRVKGHLKHVKKAFVDIFSFEDVDFTRFSFNTDDTPLIVATNRKEKKFMLIQFKVENHQNEPFGFYKIQATYTVNGKFKG